MPERRPNGPPKRPKKKELPKTTNMWSASAPVAVPVTSKDVEIEVKTGIVSTGGRAETGSSKEVDMIVLRVKIVVNLEVEAAEKTPPLLPAAMPSLKGPALIA